MGFWVIRVAQSRMIYACQVMEAIASSHIY